jgi:hypothetical protein
LSKYSEKDIEIREYVLSKTIAVFEGEGLSTVASLQQGIFDWS